MNDKDRPAAAPSSLWKPRETLVVMALVLGFSFFGLKSYFEKRVIAAGDRLREDMRIFALGINTYRNEEGAYPVAEEAEGEVGAFLPTSLTTPVPYASGLMADPFAQDPGGTQVLRYLRRRDRSTTGGDSRFDAFVLDHIGGPAEDVDYVFWSHGPDGDMDTRSPDGKRIATVRYDPTNGARSDGDLLFWGPAIGIRRNPYLGTAAQGRGPLQ